MDFKQGQMFFQAFKAGSVIKCKIILQLKFLFLFFKPLFTHFFPSWSFVTMH